VLTALLLVATLDSLPDPPADNPCVAQSKLIHQHRSLGVVPAVAIVTAVSEDLVHFPFAEVYVTRPSIGLGFVNHRVADLSPPFVIN
jgi:hypothetical protein